MSETSVKKCSEHPHGYREWGNRSELESDGEAAHQGLPTSRRSQDQLTVPYAPLGQELSRWNPSAVATRDCNAQPLTCCRDETLAGAFSDTQTFEEDPRPDQIGRSEALCKSIVYGLQEIMSLANAALLVPEARKTGCGS